MSDASVLENPSFEDKINDISQYLKTKVLDPAEIEKNSIIKEANEQKQQIIQEAEKEAQRIINAAKSKAEHEQKNLESSLRISAKQAVNSLKLILEKDVLTKSIQEPVNKVLNDDALLKEFITEIINIFLKSDEVPSLEVALSESMQKKLSDFIKQKSKDAVQNKLDLSSETIPDGFHVVLKDSGMMYDFSAESIVELLSNYLRPELRKYLFEK
jgi:V/A-type H+-transporting ATPase subunit E